MSQFRAWPPGRLAAWLASAYGVTYSRNTVVMGVAMPSIHITPGKVWAEQLAIWPDDDFYALYPERLRAYPLTRCKLQMLRLADPGFRLPATVMSGLGLGRHLGYAKLDEAVSLKTRLGAEQPEHLKHRVNLIVVQSADGSLIAGDSHHYAATPDPFPHEEVDVLILDEFRAARR